MIKVFNYASDIIPIFFIGITVFYGMMEKKNIFELFKDGVYEGLKIVYKIFPIILGLLVAVNIINGAGIFSIIEKVLGNSIIPAKIISLIFMRLISGSGAIAIVNNIFEEFGVDSIYGIFSSIMVGSTETTIYSIMMYSGCFKRKDYKVKDIVLIGFLGDFIAMGLSYIYVKFIF